MQNKGGAVTKGLNHLVINKANNVTLPNVNSVSKCEEVCRILTHQAPVVQKVDNPVQWITQSVFLILICWIMIYLLDSAIQRFSNRDLIIEEIFRMNNMKSYSLQSSCYC